MKMFSLTAILGIILLTPGLSRAEKETFTYIDCADQMTGPPLSACMTAEVNESTGELRIGDYIESGVKIVDDGKFVAISSSKYPVALPKTDRATTKIWHYNGKTYKVSEGTISADFINAGNVYTVEVYNDSYEINMKGLNNRSVPASAFLTYWYSPNKGIVAIGFPDTGSSGSVFFCNSTNCLFGSRKP